MLRHRWLALVGTLAVLLALPARGGEVQDPEWLAFRIFAARGEARTNALEAYAAADDETRQATVRILREADREPEVFADRLIGNALEASGPPRALCVEALTALGRVGVERLLARGGDAVAVEPPPAAAPPTRAVIQLECRLLEADAGVLEAVLGAIELGPEQTHRVLSPASAQALLDRAGKGLRIVHAPRLTTYDGQASNITVTNQTSYVRDYDAKKDAQGNVVLDPVVDTLQDGLVVELVPSLAGERIRVALRATVADLVRPIASLDVEIEGHSVRIQIPELTVSRVAPTMEIPDGGYAIVGGFASTDDRERVLLLKVERLELTPR